MLAVEDTSTTGGSVLTAVEALREAGAEVVGVAVIVERGAADAVAAAGLPYLTAYSLPTSASADPGVATATAAAWSGSCRGWRSWSC